MGTEIRYVQFVYRLAVEDATMFDTSTGDVFVLHVLGKPIVVINSEKAAIEIMEKRSATYGDRPPIPMLER